MALKDIPGPGEIQHGSQELGTPCLVLAAGWKNTTVESEELQTKERKKRHLSLIPTVVGKKPALHHLGCLKVETL